jgi:hypothetical protein
LEANFSNENVFTGCRRQDSLGGRWRTLPILAGSGKMRDGFVSPEGAP